MLAFVIAGVVLLFTVGIRNSYDFFNGYRLAIPTSIAGGPQSWISAHPEVSYENIVKTSDFWFLYSTNSFSSSLITGGVFEQHIINYETLQDLKYIIYSTLFIGLFLVIYAIIRLNWTSAIPVFASTIFTPILLLSMVPVLQIPVSIETINMYCVAIFFNAIFTIAFISNINNKWVRYKYNSFVELRKIINEEVKSNLFHYFSWLCLVCFGTIAVNAIFSSASLLYPFLCLFLSLFITIVVNLTVSKSLLILFITLRYKYKVKVMQANFFLKNNYDPFDEQTIDGINKTDIGKIQL